MRHLDYMQIPQELRMAKVNFGGGGSSGKIEYPVYLQTLHWDWLDDGGNESLETSIAAVMNDALGASPFAGKSAYDPTVPLTAMDGAVTSALVVMAATNWETAVPVMTALMGADPGIAAEIVAFDSEVDSNILNVVIPRFQRGMQGINAVYSSSFVLGEALIESQATIQKARFASEIRNRFLLQSLSVLADMWKFESEFALKCYQMNIEKDRIKLVALKEQAESDLQIDEADAKWDLDVFTYGGNLMAAISGGVTQTAGASRATKIASSIGGGLSGSMMGWQIGSNMGGGYYGAGIGAVIGGVLGNIQGYYSAR